MKKISCLIFSLIFIFLFKIHSYPKIFFKNIELTDIIVFEDFKFENLKDEFLKQAGIDTTYVKILSENNQKINENNYKEFINNFENNLIYEYKDIFGKKVVKSRKVYVFSKNEFRNNINIESKYKIKNISVDTVYSDSINKIFVGKVFTSPDLEENKNCYILKLDRKNNIIWGKMFEDSKINKFNKIINISDEEYCLIASVYRDSVWTDGLVLKFDKDGNFIWNDCYGSSHIDDFKDVVALDSGEIVVLAEVSNDDGDVKAPIMINNPLNTDLVLLKYDTNGKIVWQSSISNKNDIAALKIMNDDDKVIVFGEVLEDVNGENVKNIIVSGFDLNGKIQFYTIVNDLKELEYGNIK